jgi:hypothetical protein
LKKLEKGGRDMQISLHKQVGIGEKAVSLRAKMR